ncbi:hypothetical protein BKH46_05770 [Helicobacter sp. 12S02634-8]|nr:hypothetical protein BKH46_05770 [Helicobacter sp. 12S02634-8]
MDPKISIASLGGTISMTPSQKAQGITPKLSAEDLINVLPDIKGLAQIEAKSLFSLPSGYLSFEMLIEALQWAKEQVKQGASGVIFTQGTDTLEESAFLCDLFWDLPEPLIITGAMRAPEEIGADGLRNLRSAILCALSPHSAHRGVMVVMNDTIHLARWARKSHSLMVDSFCSDGKSYGVIAEGKVVYFYPPPPKMVLPFPYDLNKKVFLWEQVLDGDVGILEWVERDCDGLVISGFGAGHISLRASDLLDKVIQKIPVIVCTRTTDGPTAYHTYGYKGAEIDLIARGVCMGGYLSARKARILLWAILGNGLGKDSFKQYLQTLTIGS